MINYQTMTAEKSTDTELVYCLTNDWSYFEQERTERTEAKAPFSLFSPVKHTTTHLRDTALVSRSLAGDRDAFSRIVMRYQILICSLAYSRIGHLGQSEDVAQETFITAWKHLRRLREPAKLRAWLCGIVNYRIHKALRREGREPVKSAKPLESTRNLQRSRRCPPPAFSGCART
jgi:hypothetical protein